MQEKHCNEIPKQVTIREGLYLGHIGPRYINASAVVDKTTIGSNVLIVPGSFVNFDVPDNSVVVGNPGKIISK